MLEGNGPVRGGVFSLRARASDLPDAEWGCQAFVVQTHVMQNTCRCSRTQVAEAAKRASHPCSRWQPHPKPFMPSIRRGPCRSKGQLQERRSRPPRMGSPDFQGSRGKSSASQALLKELEHPKPAVKSIALMGTNIPNPLNP